MGHRTVLSGIGLLHGNPWDIGMSAHLVASFQGLGTRTRLLTWHGYSNAFPGNLMQIPVPRGREGPWLVHVHSGTMGFLWDSHVPPSQFFLSPGPKGNMGSPMGFPMFPLGSGKGKGNVASLVGHGIPMGHPHVPLYTSIATCSPGPSSPYCVIIHPTYLTIRQKAMQGRNQPELPFLPLIKLSWPNDRSQCVNIKCIH